MKDLPPQRVRLGAFQVDLRAGEVRDDERAFLLSDQPFQILRMLINRAGEIVTREEIKKELWPNDTVVEFDHSINAAINKLRQTLADSASAPKYIETVARRGYRLLTLPEPIPEESAMGPNDADAAVQPPPGASVPAKSTPMGASLVGKKVSHYRLANVIGAGGMGMVYEAEDLKLGRAVALKFLPEEVSDDPKAHERFQREAKAVSALNHPNICTVYEFDEYGGHPFIAMELLQGKGLRDHIAAGNFRLSQAEGLEVAIQIASGLEAAHEKGIIHRDIKPANIFITQKNVAKILDFGVAKVMQVTEPELATAAAAGFGGDLRAIDTTLTRTGVKLGTAGYMSPEQIRGEPLDARTDIFSFGLVLYEMATGERAFTGQTEAMLHEAIQYERPKPVRELAPDVTPRLADLINKALEKDPEQRWQTASELRAGLLAVKAGEERATNPHRRGRLIWAAVAVLVVLAAGLLSYWRSRNSAQLGENDTVVIAEFTNDTTDPVFVDSIAEALREELSQKRMAKDTFLNKGARGSGGTRVPRWKAVNA